METIQIVSSTNDHYAKHLGVMLNSLLLHLDGKSKINISIIDGNVSKGNKLKLEGVANKFKVPLKFLYIDKSRFSDIKSKKIRHKSEDAYSKIYTPELLNEDIHKALYLDCDLIVKEDISKLWKMNIDRYYLAAAENLAWFGEIEASKSRKKKLGFPDNTIFFNSGVMLLNLRKWRENNVSDKVLQFIKRNSSILNTLEQEALNVILHKKWIQLEPKWNYSTVHLKELPGLKPAIIHYTGKNKPWNHGHPLQDEYFKYLKTTNWD